MDPFMQERKEKRTIEVNIFFIALFLIGQKVLVIRCTGNKYCADYLLFQTKDGC